MGADQRANASTIVGWLAASLATFIAAFAAIFFVIEALIGYQFSLSLVPKELKPTGITYNAVVDDSLFGLGGFGYRLTIYSMDAAEADRVAKGGIAYLNAIALSRAESDRTLGATFKRWHETPARYMDELVHPTQPSNRLIDAYSYLKYDEGKPEIIPREADDLLASQSGFYSVGRRGYLVVEPHKRKILFMVSWH